MFCLVRTELPNEVETRKLMQLLTWKDAVPGSELKWGGVVGLSPGLGLSLFDLCVMRLSGNVISNHILVVH